MSNRSTAARLAPATASFLPSGEKATQVMGPCSSSLSVLRSLSVASVARSQKRTLVSSLPVASISLSGVKASDKTGAVCPVKVRSKGHGRDAAGVTAGEHAILAAQMMVHAPGKITQVVRATLLVEQKTQGACRIGFPGLFDLGELDGEQEAARKAVLLLDQLRLPIRLGLLPLCLCGRGLSVGALLAGFVRRGLGLVALVLRIAGCGPGLVAFILGLRGDCP